MSNSYFTKLNYTLANEDTAFELSLLPENPGHIFSVAGSGGRVLPLLAKKPSMVSCVDVSQEQLYLTEMRMESVRALTYSEFLAFWGYPPRSATPEERKDYFHRIKLSPPAKQYLEELFNNKNWESILYDGKWERTFAKLSKVNRKITGTKGAGLFHALTHQEHFEYLEKRFPKKAWALVLFTLGNAGVFNSLLYKGHFPKKNIEQSFFKFYEQCFKKLFKQGLARENFFLQILFFGKVIFAEGAPVEAKEEVFNAAKAALNNAEIQYLKGDLLENAQNVTKPIDFFSFSDVPSYFKGDTERNFLQKISKKMAPGGLAVVRNYLHVPERTDTTGFATVTDHFADLIEKEKVGVYLIDIYRRLH
jgi:S-adenosylmethionine-diacylglycerol 3-amino-3-carboxypropyl transferase